MPTPCADPDTQAWANGLVTATLKQLKKTWEPEIRKVQESAETVPPPPWKAAYTAAVRAQHGKLQLLESRNRFYLPLEEAYAPLELKRPLAFEEDRAFPRINSVRPIEEVFVDGSRYRRFALVEGDAGTGKSTALKKLAISILDPQTKVHGLDDSALPLFVRLADLRDGEGLRSLGSRAVLELPGLGSRTDIPGELWKHRNLVILVDGLDELPNDATRRRILKNITADFAQTDDVFVVVSSRPSGSQGIQIPDEFESFSICLLSKEQQESFVNQWFNALAAYYKGKTERRQGPGEVAETQADVLEQERNKVLETISLPDLSRGLCGTLLSTPLFLSLLCTISLKSNKRPKSEVDLVEGVLKVLLERPQSKGSEDEPAWTAADAQFVLQPSCHTLHSRNALNPQLPRREWSKLFSKRLRKMHPMANGEGLMHWFDAHQHLLREHGISEDRASWAALTHELQTSERRSPTAQRFIHWLHRDVDLLIKSGTDDYFFRHRTFIEYFVAKHIHIQSPNGKLMKELASELGNANWKETALYAVRLGQAELFEDLVDALRRDNPSWFQNPNITTRLGECLRQVHGTTGGFLAQDLTKSDWPQEQLAILGLFRGKADEPLLEGASQLARTTQHPEVRTTALAFVQVQRAEATGLNFASKKIILDLGVTDGQPVTLTLLEVRAGTLQMGHKNWDHTQPIHPVSLSRFHLGQDPITNQQYARFLAESKYPREPGEWRNRNYNQPLQPVVEVSWKDAQAFCIWLTEYLPGPGKIHLPSEAQWERAARNTGDRDYPWGNQELAGPDIALDRDRPAEVGTHPKDTGKFGHRDLAANVWEWCEDEYVSDIYKERARNAQLDPVQRPASTEAANEADHVMRGGAVWLDDWLDPVANRFGRPADLVLDFLGFRVCLSPPSTV